MTPIAEMSSVGGTTITPPSSVRNSLLSESLPEMNGVPKWSAASRQPSAARTRLPSRSGLSVRPQVKLSRIASRSSDAPTATALRTASSTTAHAIA